MRDVPLRCLLPVFLVVLLAGCGTLPNGHRWGEDVSFGSWERIKTATLNAATDPETWVPVAGALLLSIGDLDEDLSDWAIRETPVFGSISSAEDASDDLKSLLGATAVMHDSFMGLDEAVQLDVQVDRKEGAMLSLSWPL